ncbi:putative histone deacetylase-like protein [Scheffersomyces coipomensis]|uniref:putative histone deacetylase-like protein n=1 Tax=Scheffersomyces coipomensis TaxID=1788519 RepID=UPI00315C7D5F
MSDIPKLLQPIAEEIKKGKKVTFFNGAGISTKAGIPDFRSPKTGLYANLAKLNLPYAEAVFDIDYFRESPEAFYTLADELYPGKFAPTKYHHLIRLLQDKNQLRRVYTQNIDTLERIAGVRDEFIIEAHGSFAKNHCIDCSEEMSTERVKELMSNKEKNNGVPICESCKGYVKPDIVFFGEGLPEKLFETWSEDEKEIEIALVGGTSLTVYPFASFPLELHKDCTRVLINRERVGNFTRKKDTVLLHDCDEIATELCELLGWASELEALVKAELNESNVEENEETVLEGLEEAISKLAIKEKEGSKEESEKEITKETNSKDDSTKVDVKDVSSKEIVSKDDEKDNV